MESACPETINQIAQVTRARFELFQTRSSRWWTNDLEGACGAAALVLKDVFDKVKIESYLVEQGTDPGHCWVKVGDWNVDVTLTQFQGPKVYVSKREFPLPVKGKSFYYGNVRKIRKELINVGWWAYDLLTVKQIENISNWIIKKL